MGYRHIENLYRNKEILMFKRCYAMEKIHGTSSHVKYNHVTKELTFFSGGAKYNQFVSLFNQEELLKAFSENCEEHNVSTLTVYGEAYGGNVQKMKKTYGLDLRFIAFEVLVDDKWMDVPHAEKIAAKLGFDFVYYEEIDTTEEAINGAMMSDSVQAVRNGMGTGHMREGVVLRPLIEFIHQDGGRVICKHKREEFAERATTPKFSDPDELKVLEDARAIAEEWVTHMRLTHVLDAFPEDVGLESSNKIIKAMVDDIAREAEGEIVDNKATRKAIGKKTMEVFKKYLNRRIK